MRTLEKNKYNLWYVTPLIPVEEVDSDGFKTGQIINSYSVPSKIRLSLYPSNGEIVQQIFGMDASYDKLAVSCNLKLEKGTLLFLTEPVSNFDLNYDFRIDSIKESLNTYNYGLRSRT